MSEVWDKGRTDKLMKGYLVIKRKVEESFVISDSETGAKIAEIMITGFSDPRGKLSPEVDIRVHLGIEADQRYMILRKELVK